MQDLNDKVTGNPLAADEWNQPASEIQNVIEAAGITLSGGDLQQLELALSEFVGKVDFYDAAGTNAITLTPLSGVLGAPRLIDGLRARFIAAATNTGAMTLQLNGLTARTLTDNTGAPLVAGDVVANHVYEVHYDLASLDWRLASPPQATTTIVGISRAANFTETAAGTSDTIFITPIGLASLFATETRRGIAEEATQAEADGDSGGALFISPEKLDGRQASETLTGIIEIATTGEMTAGVDDTKAVTPAKVQDLTSTETRRGIIEIATQAEVDAGTDDERAVTPLKLANTQTTDIQTVWVADDFVTVSDTYVDITPIGGSIGMVAGNSYRLEAIIYFNSTGDSGIDIFMSGTNAVNDRSRAWLFLDGVAPVVDSQSGHLIDNSLAVSTLVGEPNLLKIYGYFECVVTEADLLPIQVRRQTATGTLTINQGSTVSIELLGPTI